MFILLDSPLPFRNFMLKKEQTPCHSRVGGNLSFHTHKQNLWIPAYAGMPKLLIISKRSCVQHKEGRAS